MPNKRNTFNLTACSEYTLRVCDIHPSNAPCEYHRAVDAAKMRGITMQAYMDYLGAQKDEQKGE